ncbi:PaaX family transcriptional regulator C-terminal domain-containing protein [Chloroflexota bacterium]
MFGTRSAMLTLYGDYVRHKGGEIGIGSLIKLLSNFGLSEQAIRSAVSRMCRMNLLNVRRSGAKSYYSLTEDGFILLDRGARRIFQRKSKNWNGLWSTVVYFIPEEKRKARDRLRQELSWLGYGPLSTATWISPHDLTWEVEEIMEKLEIKEHVQLFQSRHLGHSDARNIICRGWDLERIHKKYTDFVEEYSPKLKDHQRRLQDGESIEPSECFVERFKLIDEYRKLPFLDPDLPLEMLPDNWLRPRASALFDEFHDLLTQQANDYFDSVSKDYQESNNK